MSLISAQQSVIPALDVRILGKLIEIVRGTHDVPGIGAFKIGSLPVATHGMATVVTAIRRIAPDVPIIYDHQKGGTDIPGLGSGFAAMVGEGGADAAILFPFGGATTEREWIKACQDVGLTVLVGAEMTQEKFFEDEGGFIAKSAPGRIFEIAVAMGVADFVVPGNKPERVEYYHNLFESFLGAGNFTLYAPGFITQGGDISETGKVAGKNWHAIVGSAFSEKDNAEAVRKVALQLTQQLVPA